MTREILSARPYNTYSNEIKAEAIALAELYGYRPAVRMLAQRFPDADLPGHDLIWYWHKTLDPERFSVFQQERIARLESNLIDLGNKAADALFDELEHAGPDRKIVAGIALDKTLALLRIKSAESAASQSSNVVIQNLIQLGGDQPDNAIDTPL